MSDRKPLTDLDDEELGELVRETAVFRAAAACARFADEANELRENDSLAFDRLVRETHERQPTSVSKRDTSREIIETFVDVVEDHAALADYVDGPREDVIDDHGRRPLVTTTNGRIAVSTIRDTSYRVTRPCWRGEECPHDRDPDDCEATHYGSMSKCPSARSPHDFRSGRVTAHRLGDEDRTLVSDRMDASEEVLDKHYDRRSHRQRAEQRRDHFDL